MRSFLLVATLALCFACQKGEKTGDNKDKPGSAAGTGSAPAEKDKVESADILARTKTEAEVQVKHVLYGWKELAAAYRGQMDPRAQNRTKAEAEKLATAMMATLKKTPPDQLDAIIKENSEDPGSKSGNPYTVKADTPFVPEFKNLALRLNLNEVGIVKTNYGYHVMIRITPPPPPPPDPLESADILGRAAPTEKITSHVQHILISWKDAPGARDPRAKARSKEDADKLVKELFEKVKNKGDMVALMKEHSEDPGSNKDGKAYPVQAGSGMVEPFEKISLRLNEGETGIVKTQFGFHIVKRVPPPPPPKPDSLDSVDILKRPVKTEKAKVKHVLVGWTEVNAGDERGKKRSRKDLEKLVKDTIAKLKKGDAIEPIMKELSEDPGSAASGEGYDVTPDAGLVQPFKDLSLRLDVKEVGAVKTDFGIHIIQRVE
jgi:parvulin-like peptidyl-prolyl isomerase